MASYSLKEISGDMESDLAIVAALNRSCDEIDKAEHYANKDGLELKERTPWVASCERQALVHAAHAQTLAVARLIGVLESLLVRFEPSDDADDTISILSDPERLPPEKTASGERTKR